MKIWRTKRVQLFAALFAFTMVGGYLVTDAIADATHGCAAESSEDSGAAGGCAMCVTCPHGGALLASETPVSDLAAPIECDLVVLTDEQTPEGPPARIDHPPQLA